MEENAMADYLGGIKHIGPSYPVKPVQPTQKERETGGRNKKRQRPESENEPIKRDDDDQTPHIDEHV
jgi:hypothetical protein